MFFDKEFLDYKELPFNELIVDDYYYSDADTKGWHKIDLGHFKIETPKDYRFYKLMGVDSFVGGITNGTDSIMFDFGMYSNTLTSFQTERGVELKKELINGKQFNTILIEELHVVACYTDDLKAENRLMMICYECENLEEKLRMFRT